MLGGTGGTSDREGGAGLALESRVEFAPGNFNDSEARFVLR